MNKKTYITSDLHLGHRRIIEFCPDSRPYFGVDEMNEAIIKMWNEDIESDDSIVYILGDVSFAHLHTTVELLKRMRGRKILVRGNHDSKLMEETRFRSCFESVHDYLEVKHNGYHLAMFHFPLWEWHKMHYGTIHFHGHLHGETCPVPGRIMDVGIDGNGGRVYDLDVLIQKMLHKPIRPHHNINTSDPADAGR